MGYRSITITRRKSPRRRIQRLALVIIAPLLVITSAYAQRPLLTSAVIRGSSVYTAADLFASYRDHLGMPITNASARAISSAVAERYERDGYSRPQIRVDDALLAAGILRIDVLEARIGRIQINGEPGPHRERLEQLGADLGRTDVVRQKELQDVLRRMRALPGLTLSAATARDESESNVYRLDLDTQFKPYSGALRFTNRGTDEVGPAFVLGQAVANGLLGGRTTAGVLFGSAEDYGEYRGIGGLTSFAIGNDGARTTVTGFRSRSNPTEPGTDRDDVYVRDRLSLKGELPLRQGQRADLKLAIALDLEDLAILRTGERLRDERLRMLEAGLSSTWRNGSWSQSIASAEIVKGLDGLGSGLSASDLSNDPRSSDFVLLRASLIRLMRLNDSWSVRLDSFAQLANDVLPYSERFKIGGDRLGRGFEVAEIAGDSGTGAKVELRRELGSPSRIFGRTSVYGFYDIAATWKENVPGRESAASAGFGFSLRGQRTTGVLEFAKPLTHADVEGNRDVSMFIEVTLQL